MLEDYPHDKQTFVQSVYELRHAWNRIVYQSTRSFSRPIQRLLRRRFFAETMR